MKSKSIAVIAIVIFIFLPARVLAENEFETDEKVKKELQDGTNNILDELDLSELEELYNSTKLSESISFRDFMNDISAHGLSNLSFDQIIELVLSAFKKSLSGSFVYMAEIVILLMLTGLIKSITTDKSNNGAGKTAFYAGYVICAVISASILVGSMFTARSAVDDLAKTVNTITPILVTVLTGLGSVSSSSVMSPILATLTGTVFGAVKNIVFPAITISAVMNILTNISSTIKFDKLCELIESGVKWFMGIVFTLFLGISALKGTTGAAIDGVTFKTAKLTIDKTIPYVGGMFSDTLDTIMACGLIAKNAVGTAGLIVIMAIMLYPIAALIINIFLFKAGAAVAQPFADDKSIKMLYEMSKVVTLTFVTVLTCTLMAFILIALFLGTADMGFMMR